MENKPEKLFVLGMHRSGTSLATKLLNIYGFDIGTRKENGGELMIAKSANNPSGHWENIKMLKTNKVILRDFGGRWAYPPRFPENWWENEKLDKLVETAKSLSSYLAKDPRTVLTFPFWQRFFNIKTVVVVRDKDAITSSLCRRRPGHFNKANAGELYEKYMEALFSYSYGDMVVVRYENFFKIDPVEIIEYIIKALDLPRKEYSKDEIREFVNPELKHFN